MNNKFDYYKLIGPELIKRELGVHNWVDDRGGMTAHGVTERLAVKYNLDVRKITTDIAMQVFEQEFYRKQRLHEMPDIQIAWRLTIDGLHSGSASIIKRMQETMRLYGPIDIKADGIAGEETRAALMAIIGYLEKDYARRGLPHEGAHSAAICDVCSQLKAMQFAHYRAICLRDETQVKWWKGWLNRIRYEPDWYRGDVLNMHRHNLSS